jgi:hypothetical protein
MYCIPQKNPRTERAAIGGLILKAWLPAAQAAQLWIL